MSEFFEQLKALVSKSDILISNHGYDEIIADNLSVRDVVSGMADAEVLEEYPDYPKGPCVLVLENDQDRQPFHVVWGIPRGSKRPAVLITAYRPDPVKWTKDFRRRK